MDWFQLRMRKMLIEIPFVEHPMLFEKVMLMTTFLITAESVKWLHFSTVELGTQTQQETLQVQVAHKLNCDEREQHQKPRRWDGYKLQTEAFCANTKNITFTAMNAPRNLLECLITLKPLCAHAYEHGVHQHNAPAHTHTHSHS